MEELEWERKMLQNVPRVYTEEEFYGLINQHSTNELINRSLGIVITTISNNYGYYHDLDELYGIGVNALLDAVHDYSYDEGPYTDYLRRKIKEYLDSYILGEVEKDSIDELVEEDYPSDEIVIDNEELLNQVMLHNQIDEVLEQLSIQQELVLRGFFGIGCEKKTYGMLATELGLTVDQVRTIKDNALKALKHPVYSRKIRDYAYDVNYEKEARIKQELDSILVYAKGGKHE